MYWEGKAVVPAEQGTGRGSGSRRLYVAAGFLPQACYARRPWPVSRYLLVKDVNRNMKLPNYGRLRSMLMNPMSCCTHAHPLTRLLFAPFWRGGLTTAALSTSVFIQCVRTRRYHDLAKGPITLGRGSPARDSNFRQPAGRGALGS